jgi:glycosyltransferase involved in cell wall biosynthesis
MSVPDRGRRYVLITPCRDEAAFARRTLDSVTAQSVRPALWVIVDDGSSDATPAILAEYAARFDFIRIVHREDRGRRSVGPGVVDAFYAGYDTIDPTQFEYICKLDLDLDLPRHYFERLMERMEAEPRLGTCSGKPYYPRSDGRLVSEDCGDETSVGMSKFYRVECFMQVGGFVHEVMWDGIDCHRCRMLGWIARSWDDSELRFVHLRPMGSSERGILTGRLRSGRGQYYMGTSFAYMTASALYRAMRHPLVIGGLAMWWGYVSSLIRRAPRYDEPDFRRFLRSYQWDCLVRGKAAATRRLDERQAAQWRPGEGVALSAPSGRAQATT